jgi:CheY-like chemotaxis protein
MISDPAAAEQAHAAELVLSRTARDLPRLDCRILVAEDSPDNGRVVRHVLECVGAEVELVENGRLAVERALAARDEGRPFDLILMDMQMPIVDGYQATRTLRSQGYTLPIIALTAHAMQEERQRCLECGCDEYQSKPIQREELIEVIRRCLGSVKDDDGQ